VLGLATFAKVKQAGETGAGIRDPGLGARDSGLGTGGWEKSGRGRVMLQVFNTKGQEATEGGGEWAGLADSAGIWKAEVRMRNSEGEAQTALRAANKKAGREQMRPALRLSKPGVTWQDSVPVRPAL
jgi:hypothetical protein